MSHETLDLRRSVQIVRRHKILMGIMVALGLLAGGAYAVLKPPMVTSTALVLLPQSEAAQTGAQAAANGGPNPYTATQEVIAESNSVLVAALPHVRPAMSIDQLRRDINIGSPTSYIISVSAAAKVGADAATTANAVADSYINNIGSSNNQGGQVQAILLQSAAVDTGSGDRKSVV